MTRTIEEWLEAKTGATRRQMALKLGQSPSTFYRNIDTAEVIIAVCRAYDVNPVEGLVYAGHLDQQEVLQAATTSTLSEVAERELLEEVLRRVETRESSELAKPIDLNARQDPDYSEMSEDEAFELGLVAKKQDDNIGYNEAPRQP